MKFESQHSLKANRNEGHAKLSSLHIVCRGAASKARRLGFGGGPRRHGRQVRPTFQYDEDDTLDLDDNWEALHVSCGLPTLMQWTTA